MFTDKFQQIREALTYDDVLLIPSRTAVEPREVNISSNFSRHIKLKVPIVSSPMDTVTESGMAMAMAKQGALGIIHRNITMNQQIGFVRRDYSTGRIHDHSSRVWISPVKRTAMGEIYESNHSVLMVIAPSVKNVTVMIILQSIWTELQICTRIFYSSVKLKV